MPRVYMIQSTKKIIEMLPNITEVLKLIIGSFPIETLNNGWTKLIWFLGLYFLIAVTIKLMSRIVTQNPLNLAEEKNVINKTDPELVPRLFEWSFTYIFWEFKQISEGILGSLLWVKDLWIGLHDPLSKTVDCKVIRPLKSIFVLKMIRAYRLSSFIAITDQLRMYIDFKTIISPNDSEIIDKNILPLRMNQSAIREFILKSLEAINIGNVVILKIMVIQQQCDNNWLMTVRFCGSIPNL